MQGAVLRRSAGTRVFGAGGQRQSRRWRTAGYGRMLSRPSCTRPLTVDSSLPRHSFPFILSFASDLTWLDQRAGHGGGFIGLAMRSTQVDGVV